MDVIAVASQKGGVGKSTLAVHLASELMAQGGRALIIDLDPQGSALRWGVRRGELPPDVVGINPASIDKEIARARSEGFHMVVIDTAPHADSAALQAVRPAGLVLIPCRPSILDLDAIEATLSLCSLAKRRSLVVMNAAPTRSRVTAEAMASIGKKGGRVTEAIVRHRVAFQHCMIDGRVAAEYEQGGAAEQEIKELLAVVHTELGLVEDGSGVQKTAVRI